MATTTLERITKTEGRLDDKLENNLLRNYLNTAISAARAAAHIHQHNLNTDLEITSKSSYTDLVTKVDKESEAKIREIIAEQYPSHIVLGEEEGARGNSDSKYRWIVDPLDGTINYAHGFPFYCVSIALEINGKIVLGVVLDSHRNELFSALSGEGAYCNGVPINISQQKDFSKALLATGFSYNPEEINDSLAIFKRVFVKCRGIRRPGAAALDLCYVACGRLEGFWETKLNPWDVAAGVLIIQEAGGSITNAVGGIYHLNDPIIIASNGHLHTKLVAAVGLEPTPLTNHT